MGMVVKRFEVYALNVDRAPGPEPAKTRPCVIISPDETNRFIETVIVAPISSKGHRYPTRVPCTVDGKKAQVILDQIRTVDKARLASRMGRLDRAAQRAVLDVLAEMFAE